MAISHCHWHLVGLTQSKKTSLMTTPKCLGVQIWQMNLLWLVDPPVPEQRYLEYQYTKLGRWTYFGQWIPPVPEQKCFEYQYTKLGRWTYFCWWTPPVPEQRCLEYQYTKLGRWTYFGQWITPSTRVEMLWIPVHTTWQTNLLWQMDPPPTSKTCTWQMNLLWLMDPHTLARHILGRWTYPINRAEMHCIPVHQNWQTNLCWLMDSPPKY